MRSVLLIITAVLMNSAVLAAPHQSDSEVCDTLTPAIRSYIDSGMFQGNLLLAKEGRVLCHKSVGFGDEGVKTPISADTQFPIASVSKPIVATLLLKLQEQGVLDLQSTLNSLLPGLKAPWAKQVTLHHLLANRSGLPNHFELPGWEKGRYRNTLPMTELLKEIAKMELAFTPGTQYRYSNLGWLLIGEAVKNVTGSSLEENMQKHIFSPLKLTNSGFVSNAETPLVTGFRWGKQGGWQPKANLNMQVFNAGSGLYSTSKDLVKYLDTLHRENLLSTQSYSQMFSPDTPYAWRTESLTLAPHQIKQIHSYDGQLQGYCSLVYYLIEDDVSLVLLNNTGMGFEHKTALAEDVLKAFYGVEYPDRSNAPSLKLNKSMLNNQWAASFARLQSEQIKDMSEALLVIDLAQQLEWSGHLNNAVDLYTWLLSSFPGNQNLINLLNRLCDSFDHHLACRSTGNVNVGMKVLSLEDTSRNAWRSSSPRPMTTHLFYPTMNKNVEPLMLGPEKAPLFNAGLVARESTPIGGKRPLVLMSHGTGGSALQLLWLATALVKEGYIVAAVNHHGNTALEAQKYPEGFLLWWERTRDLQVVSEQVYQDKQWRDLIDTSNVAAVGFSLGGYTALSALGAITDKTRFNEYCQRASDDFSCQPQPEFERVLEAFEEVKDTHQVRESMSRQHDSYKIASLKAAIVIAPAVVKAFKPDSLANIAIPTLMIVGNKDEIAPSKPNAEYAHSLIPNSQFETINNGHHYSFLSQCTEQGKRILPQLCSDPHGIARHSVHHQAINQTVSFLKKHFDY